MSKMLFVVGANYLNWVDGIMDFYFFIFSKFLMILYIFCKEKKSKNSC